jgi:glycosyltransferase involved in cell wall biosynthesis
MREYEQRFPNKVRCIWHKENLRLGGARNTGIRAARGEFIYCVDSDDYIDLELCKKMYNAIVAENADMAVCDTNRIEKKIIIKNWKANGKFNTSDLCERIKNLKMHCTWFIMIKKSVIENNNLYIQEQTTGYEDFVCSLWYLASKKIARVNEALYYYCIRDDSAVQGRTLQTYISTIEIFKNILSSSYFNNLDLSVKKSLFLYLIKWIPKWLLFVCVNYADDFTKFCNSVLDLFQTYKVDYSDSIYIQSEENTHSREILRFIEQNLDTTDFNLEFIAYYECQSRKMRLKTMRRLISPYADKRLTLWGAGMLGKGNARDMSVLGFKFEIIDINPEIHGEKILANVVVKPWDEVKDRTDVVLVSARGFFEDVREKLSRESPDIEVVDLIGLLLV